MVCGGAVVGSFGRVVCMCGGGGHGLFWKGGVWCWEGGVCGGGGKDAPCPCTNKNRAYFHRGGDSVRTGTGGQHQEGGGGVAQCAAGSACCTHGQPSRQDQVLSLHSDTEIDTAQPFSIHVQLSVRCDNFF